MEIRIRATGQVMLEPGFRVYLANSNGPSYETLTPEIMEQLGVDPVFEGPQATPTTVYEYSQRSGVEEINGKWYTKYILGPTFVDIPASGDLPAVSAAQQLAEYKQRLDLEQASRIRQQRSELLKNSDWTQGKDISDTISTPWAAYRQQLRDLPQQDNFPWTVVWPTQPE